MSNEAVRKVVGLERNLLAHEIVDLGRGHWIRTTKQTERVYISAVTTGNADRNGSRGTANTTIFGKLPTTANLGALTWPCCRTWKGDSANVGVEFIPGYFSFSDAANAARCFIYGSSAAERWAFWLCGTHESAALHLSADGLHTVYQNACRTLQPD
jgi:hypothetical protein